MIEVRVGGGTVRGAVESGVAVFRGIPFAAPPVGALRFAAPRPAAAWEGVRDALTFGPPPPQAAVFGMDERGSAGDDWLTVNVWSPDVSANLPVLVWIQGGGYTIGMSGQPEYDGARLASDGVVVVTFNYRVGMEGFAAVEGAPANRGLLDQVAALEWVRDNIRGFGGDPGRVTVFGESAGGGSIAALLVMPRAAGLFHRAVASSVPGAFFTPELAADIATACAAELGLRPTDEDLSTVDPAMLPIVGDEITAKIGQFADRWGQAAHKPVPFAPVVDGDVLPVVPWEGLTGDVDLIVGHTRHEQRLFTVLEGLLGQVTPAQADAALEVFAPGDYRAAFPDAGPDELYELVGSDWLFRMPSLHLAEAQVAAGGRAHVYEVTWEPPDRFGACHGLDVPLLFGNLAHGGTAAVLGPVTADTEEVSARLRAALIGFAVDGDPGWPLYDKESRLTQLLDVPASVAPYPEETSRRLWASHRFTALPLIGE